MSEPNAQRQFLALPVRVVVGDSEAEREPDYAINVSRGGICLQTSSPRPPGETVHLSFWLRSSPEPIEVDAEVVWSRFDHDRPPGLSYAEMGLRFLNLCEEDGKAIDRFIEGWADAWTDEDEVG
jgi:uncharacterized protein (TIGR02266 family)